MAHRRIADNTVRHLAAVPPPPTRDPRLLPGLEHVPPGVAYQAQAAHNAAVASLEALLAAARQEADRLRAWGTLMHDAGEAYRAELLAAREEIAAARRNVEEARLIVAAYRVQAGRLPW